MGRRRRSSSMGHTPPSTRCSDDRVQRFTTEDAENTEHRRRVVAADDYIGGMEIAALALPAAFYLPRERLWPAGDLRRAWLHSLLGYPFGSDVTASQLPRHWL